MKCPHCGKNITDKPLSIMDLKDIIQSANSEIQRLENCHARITPHGLAWSDTDSLSKWKELKRKVREANRKLAELKI